MAIIAAPAAAALLNAAEAPNSDPDESVRRLLARPAFQALAPIFERDHERFVAELIALNEIPAPPFGEGPRAAAYLKMLAEAGLSACEIDAEGNALGLWRGTGDGPLLVVAAHLDTVFPAGTDVRVKRSGTRLVAPGVGDNAYSLAFLVALARAMREAKLATPGDILFVGNVGEEGPGDLRGVRFLFERSPWREKIRRFIAVDGWSNDIVTNGALGSIRYRVSFRGPGGHSWTAFGEASPAFALGGAIAKLGALRLPDLPKVSYNVGVLSGGTSVNSIPHEVSMEVDLRSVSADALQALDAEFQRIVNAAVDEENSARATTFGRISAELKRTGDRPSGITSPESPTLHVVRAAMRAFDKVPVWQTSSTDANVPISRGIPAFAIAAKAATHGDRAHSLAEWVDVEKAATVQSFTLAAAIILAVAEHP